ncbi:MAG: histidine phosphatase family protein [Wenzhouxiangellaceae bacterium]
MPAIYLIRHGQASFEAEDYDQLSTMGERQSQLLGASLKQRRLKPAHAFSGTMRRHQQTASHCLSAMDASLSLQTLPALNEYDHRAIIAAHTPRYADTTVMRAEMAQQAEPWRAFQKFYSAAVERWMNPDYASDYQEPWNQFRQRCLDGLQQVVDASDASENVLVFTSGGPIMAVCQHLLGLSPAQSLQMNWLLLNSGVTQLQRKANGYRLSSFNEHAHIEADSELLTYR